MATRGENAPQQPIVVVGAGLVGAMTAILLSKRGYSNITVFDGRDDPSAEAQGGADGVHGRLGNVLKRSINLALSHRGICALKEIGLEGRVLGRSVAMEGRMIHPPGEKDAKNTVFQPYDHRPGQAIYSISREELNLSLLDEIKALPAISVVFRHKFESMTSDGRVTLQGPDGKRVTEPSVVIGADGAFSKVRDQLGRFVRLDYQRSYIESGYKELTIPPTKAGEYAMDIHALHIWPRGDFMLIALPNEDCSFTATLFAPFASLDALTSPQELKDFFTRWFPDIAANDFALMPTLVEDYFRNPTSPLLSVKCSPWHYQGTLLLLGDASHATVPFYGQGMNAGFEDALRLYEMLGESSDLPATFARFSTEMVPSRYGLVDASLDNYEEMRSKTNSRLFALKRRLDWLLESVLPEGTWSPLYTMVTFSRTHYHEAKAKARRQDAILNAALSSLGVAAAATLATLLLRSSRR